MAHHVDHDFQKHDYHQRYQGGAEDPHGSYRSDCQAKNDEQTEDDEPLRMESHGRPLFGCPVCDRPAGDAAAGVARVASAPRVCRGTTRCGAPVRLLSSVWPLVACPPPCPPDPCLPPERFPTVVLSGARDDHIASRATPPPMVETRRTVGTVGPRHATSHHPRVSDAPIVIGHAPDSRLRRVPRPSVKSNVTTSRARMSSVRSCGWFKGYKMHSITCWRR